MIVPFPKARVVILGSKGRLGSALSRLWSPGVLPLSRQELDISNLAQIAKMFAEISCDVVVNCAGLTNVDYCEDNPKEAFLLNATAPALMAQRCADNGIRFIHFSTDYVFEGKHPKMLAEEDPAVPLNQYGYSKLEGENEVLRASDTHVVLRVSWVFGPDKPSFIDYILAQALNQDRVAAVADKTSCPSYTYDLAEWTKIFLNNGVKGGLYHLCNSGHCTWREYGQHALDCALECEMPLKATTIDPLTLEEMRAFKAKRPRHSAMSTEKFVGIFGHPLRPWKDAVRDYIYSFKTN